MRRYRHLLAALALAATGAGCELIVKLDPSLLPDAGLGGSGGMAMGTTGSGGASTTSTTTGTGGTGGTSTTTGTGGGCTSATECPASTNICADAVCNPATHKCEIDNIAAGDPAAASAQTAGDCKQVVCDGAGKAMSVNDDTDVPDDGEVCTDDSCSNGVAVHTPNTDTCSENSGKVCGSPSGPKAGKCVACNVDVDCGPNAICQLNLCVTSSCNDQVQDGTETDVDCGGSCAPCPDHLKCLINMDCQSENCDATKTCTPASCTDGVENENESDVDCGGPVCRPEGKLCAAGKMCVVAADCQSDSCDTVGHDCKAPTCFDGIINEGESDVDCGGSLCSACPNGKKCFVDTDCASDGCQSATSLCVPQCTDGHKDGMETDVDCGGPSCSPCALGGGCMVDSDCAGKACDAVSNKCIADQCADHRVDGVETDVDCGGGTCGTCALNKKCLVDTDCASTGCQSTALICVAPCADGHKDGAETDIDCGGGTCNTCALGKACKHDSDCASTGCQSTSLVCVAPCADGHQDGAETDVDCGGGTCGTCAASKKCKVDADCSTNACDAVALTCAANQCVDNQQDGAETDVDCGGGTCPTCAVTKKCKVDADCFTNACDAVSFTCIASQCFDHHLDGVETDVDCGGGMCPTCAITQSCLIDADCTSDACDGITFQCVPLQCFDHHQDGVETDVDCGGTTCAGCATGKMCLVDTDCADAACDAMSFLCVADQCSDHRMDGAETDVDCGGTTCAGCATGKMCLGDGDCANAACDATSNLCVADQCHDDRMDGAETDVDCGGTTCGACATGKKCLADSDCATNACDGISLLCVALQCSDDRLDGAETDVDCGGTTCGACANGQKCLVDTDCLSNACDGISLLCAAFQCSDDRMDGSETDVDCGGSCAGCATGKKCLVDGDCLSSACDGVSFLCVADQCHDDRMDGTETDVDCGGGGCGACASGDMCAVDTDCLSSACDGMSFVCVADQCHDNRMDGTETDVDCGGGGCSPCGTGKACGTGTDCVSGTCTANQCT